MGNVCHPASPIEQTLRDLQLPANRTAADLRGTARESFPSAAAAGVLTAGLAQWPAPSAGLGNLLVHRYGDVRSDRLALDP